ncbi:Nramp family divalent metal transporter [Coraliomargarita sp. SDUM461004]|uniref:Nramp family divalent metal transporter n=1 Tax=Thalassobacterium sedimentorum TaxID=3041258 RepID=A0ABU1AFS8_9BACT|nr:Nramp family divalent metal transporter [Coraliomargarita sp. SDUM461004]MDQ8193682.1 Nramp family divalent metal transporter [Coraliomargarita sp. SDUM461004]
MNKLFRRFVTLVLSVGPGIFAIGYTLGTGSVTSMSKAGSQFGFQLLWVLALSCVFSGVLMEAAGRYALVTGGTAANGCKRYLPGGKWLSIIMVVGVVIGQWFCLSGLVGLSSSAVYEGLRLFVPSLSESAYWPVLGIAIVILVAMYGLLWHGGYSFFEKILVLFVTLLGVSFLLSMFVVMPSAAEIATGLLPTIPEVPGSMLMIAAFVGTTMAAPTFVVRPLLVKSKGWTEKDMLHQRRDAIVGATLMFILSGSIMACAAGALHSRGFEVNDVLDMVITLEPVAGRFAVAFFLLGTLSAGLSSIFPICMVAPLLVGDYQNGEFDSRSKTFRILCAVACLLGLTVPVLGANPIVAQILTQVAQVFVLPLVIVVFATLVNKQDLMGEHRAGILLNAGLSIAFVFSLIISFIAIKGLGALLSSSVVTDESTALIPPESWMVCVTDQRYTQVGGGERIYSNARPGALLAINAAALPQLEVKHLASIPTSLIGPPTSVAITPNNRYALVTAAMQVDPNNSQKQIPDTRLSVVSLSDEVPTIVQSIELGFQPSGVDINAAGTRALVANRADGTVSLIEIMDSPEPVHLLGTFSVASPESSVSHVVFSPNGQRALITLNKADAVLYVSVENDEVNVLQRIEGRDGPYAADFSPEGGLAVIGNVDDGTVTVLKVEVDHVEAYDTIPIGILAEGVDISPDGRWLAVNCLDNSNQSPENPAYRSSGMVMLLERQGSTFVACDLIRVGGIPQAAVFTPDSRYLGVASNTEQDIRFYEISKHRLRDTRINVACPGGPAAMRIANHF